MYYLIGRDLDGDGEYEFIQNMDNMILTEEPSHALQVTENELNYIDMQYLNQSGFYAIEASNFRAPILPALLFRTTTAGYRPRIAPPPRRPRRPAPPHMGPGPAPRPPMGGRPGPAPRAARPAPMGGPGGAGRPDRSGPGGSGRGPGGGGRGPGGPGGNGRGPGGGGRGPGGR